MSRALKTNAPCASAAVYPAAIVGIPPMEDFYIGGASVKLFLPIFKMNFPEIVDLALPAEGVFHNLGQGGYADFNPRRLSQARSSIARRFTAHVLESFTSSVLERERSLTGHLAQTKPNCPRSIHPAPRLVRMNK